MCLLHFIHSFFFSFQITTWMFFLHKTNSNCFKVVLLLVVVSAEALSSPPFCFPFTAAHEASVLLKCADGDIGRSLQGSYWISITTSCVSLIPPFLCSHFLPPQSSSISFLAFSSLAVCSPHPPFMSPVLFMLPHVLWSPRLEISLASSSPPCIATCSGSR